MDECLCVKCGTRLAGQVDQRGIVVSQTYPPTLSTSLSQIKRAICPACDAAFRVPGRSPLTVLNYGGPAAWVPGEPLDDMLVEADAEAVLGRTHAVNVLASYGTGTPDYEILVPVDLKTAIWVWYRFMETNDIRLGRARDAMFDSLRQWRHRIGDVEVWIDMNSDYQRIEIHAAPAGFWTDMVTVEHHKVRRSLGEDGDEDWKTEMSYGSVGVHTIEFHEKIKMCFEVVLFMAGVLRSRRFGVNYDDLLKRLLDLTEDDFLCECQR